MITRLLAAFMGCCVANGAVAAELINGDKVLIKPPTLACVFNHYNPEVYAAWRNNDEKWLHSLGCFEVRKPALVILADKGRLLQKDSYEKWKVRIGDDSFWVDCSNIYEVPAKAGAEPQPTCGAGRPWAQ